MPKLPLDGNPDSVHAERLIEIDGVLFRLHTHQDSAQSPAVLLPLDQLFEIRVAAAVRLWRGLTRRKPGPNPAVLSRARQDRLVLALRALDGRQDHASYREIADVLFGAASIPARGWKTHDVRDRTIRLVRFGLDMMQSGYRRLLLHPYRRRQ